MRGTPARTGVISLIVFCIVLSGCLANQDSGGGTLRLASSPSGAEVYLDNVYRGSTPSTITGVIPGDHTIEFRSAGYQNWSTEITSSGGIYLVYASLAPVTPAQAPVSAGEGIPAPSSPYLPAIVTVDTSKSVMVVGSSITFFGSCSSGDNVSLVLYGPGYYANGITIAQPKVSSGGSWSYTWNPGYSVQSGSYTAVVSDATKSVSDRAEFAVVGGGEVTITMNRYTVNRGDTITFSGRCTTGAGNVILALSGPGMYSNGVEIGRPSVVADKSWTYKYNFNYGMPPGYYSVSVYDAQQTASAYVQFFISSSLS